MRLIDTAPEMPSLEITDQERTGQDDVRLRQLLGGIVELEIDAGNRVLCTATGQWCDWGCNPETQGCARNRGSDDD